MIKQGVFDLDREAKAWTQDGAFPDADGKMVRAYDDVVLTRAIAPENDPNASYMVSEGTTGTVLFHTGRPDGVAQLELYCDPVAVVIGYEDQRHLRLHMTNEEKYPR